MRWMGLLGMLAVGAMANASFELMLVSDYNGRDIDRYDPVTGTYLGSFGAGFLSNPSDVDVDATTGLAYVVDVASQNIKVFNYNTGEFIRSWSTGQSNFFITRLNSGNILVSNYGNSNSQQFTPTGTLIRTQTTNAAYVEGHTQTSDGNVWWVDSSGRRLMRGSETTASPTFVYSQVNPAGQEFLSSSGTDLASINFAFGTGISATRYSTSGGVVTSEASVSLASLSTESNGGTAFGHGGVLYAALTTATTSRYLTWVRGDNFAASRALSQTQYAQGMAVVVAPEPASMLALGVGLLAMRRRGSRTR